jgi:hypothetical protein
MPSSAPCLRAKASFSLDEATAMTRAPMSLPISTAASPAPPAAPKHRKRLAFLEVATVLEAVQRRAVGNGNSCRGLIAYTVRNDNDVACLGDHLFAAAIAAGESQPPF